MSGLSDWIEAAPLVIAHRGASAVAPENTLAAFELAVQLGADAIELDAKLTRDGQVVCCHDRELLRTAGVPGTVGASSLQELQALDVGGWKAPGFAGTRIPALPEVLEAVAARILVNVELTDYYGSDQSKLVAAVVAVVRRQGLERRVLLSSFESRALRAAESMAPDIPRAHLVGPTWLAYRDRLSLRRAQVQAEHPHVSFASPGRIDAIRRTGRRVHVYTVDDAAVMRRLWGGGVDGLITDQPDLARRTRETR